MKRLPTWLEIDLDKLVDNIEAIQHHVGVRCKVLLTIKADGYGHGAVQLAAAVDDKVAMFGVATLDEATELQGAAVTSGILILSPILESEIPAVVDGGFGVTISSFRIAEEISRYASAKKVTVPVHIEIDTGMGRTGIAEEFGREEVARVAELPGMKLHGVYTHFPSSDTDGEYTRDQIARFKQIIAELRSDGVDIPLIHSANSAAIAGIETSHMDLVRPGLVAYGLGPANGVSPVPVQPILTWKSRIVRVRRVAKGRSISYGRTYVTGRDSVIGVIPVGYGHGYPFRAGNGGEVIVGGCRVPIVGRVTMDMIMVDLTDMSELPEPGAEVVLVGTQGTETVTFHDVANWSGSICWEIMCGINKRVPRTYLRKGKIETFKSLLGIIPNHITV